MATAESIKLSPLAVKRALNRNIVAGSFGVLFGTCVSMQFVTQFALNMGASKFQIGLLTSLPLLGYPFQLLAAYLTERIRQRKRFWFVCSVTHRFLWLPMLAIPYLIGHEFQNWQIAIFLTLYFLSSTLGTMASAPWFSWMADLVPPDQAGKFWSRRTAVLNGIMLTVVFMGKFVDLFDKGDMLPFVVLFAVGFVVGELDLIIHNKIPEPPMSGQPKKLDLLGMLKEPIRDPKFRRFLWWNCSWSFAVTVYSAFAMVYFLEVLKLSQFFISVLVCVMLVSRIFMARYWGFLADRFGHTAVNTICDFCLLFVPLTYLFVTPTNYFWPLIVLHLLAGVFNVGLDTASTALMLNLSSAENKSMFIAVLTALAGVVAAVAPFLGGWVLQHFEGHSTQFLFWQFDNFKMLFLVGFLLRLAMFPFSLRLDDIGGGSTARVVRRLADTNPFRVIRHVYVLTDSSAEAERVNAVQELAQARSAIATRELIHALEDPSREVRLEAARALARIGDTESVEPLIGCLRSSDSGIQQTAAHSLGKLHDPRAVPALVEALQQPHLAQVAAIALGEIGDRAAVEPLLALLRNKDVPEATRASVAYALSRLRETSALPDMLASFRGTQSPLVRQELALAIGNLLGPLGEFYRILTRERQVAGQEVTRLQERIARDSDRFKSNPGLIQHVMRQLEQAQTGYGRDQWKESALGYTRAGLLLSGSLPMEDADNGILDFFADKFRPSRRHIERELAHPDQSNAPLWFLLALAYPHAAESLTSATREETLLAFYAFYRIWAGKTG